MHQFCLLQMLLSRHDKLPPTFCTYLNQTLPASESRVAILITLSTVPPAVGPPAAGTYTGSPKAIPSSVASDATPSRAIVAYEPPSSKPMYMASAIPEWSQT